LPLRTSVFVFVPRFTARRQKRTRTQRLRPYFFVWSLKKGDAGFVDCE
jgi:hypothetical protein